MDMKHIRPIRAQANKVRRAIDKLMQTEEQLCRQLNNPNLSEEELAPIRRRFDRANSELEREFARQDRLLIAAARQEGK
ncbi:hypothetical protein LNKW23_02880 [Paralimibaculum aggregatum]|uniref:Uncharacterized protein n=1 Tax=Paralimibaculum aggregatum TaxID=3036245 RepID=A0ABQ6LCJ0_9RHOB|nr:hypothetical protein [Limibaculum sp. NKW23]GMG81076.1 hypothetical protein LNKW23_02880 [Limibaculum sp. NKW23]